MIEAAWEGIIGLIFTKMRKNLTILFRLVAHLIKYYFNKYRNQSRFIITTFKKLWKTVKSRLYGTYYLYFLYIIERIKYNDAVLKICFG